MTSKELAELVASRLTNDELAQVVDAVDASDFVYKLEEIDAARCALCTEPRLFMTVLDEACMMTESQVAELSTLLRVDDSSIPSVDTAEHVMQVSIEEQIAAVSSVLEARGVDSKTMLREMSEDGLKGDDVLQSLVGALYSGLTYGNWAPKRGHQSLKYGALMSLPRSPDKGEL